MRTGRMVYIVERDPEHKDASCYYVESVFTSKKEAIKRVKQMYKKSFERNSEATPKHRVLAAEANEAYSLPAIVFEPGDWYELEKKGEVKND